MEYLDSVSGGDPSIIKEIVIIFREQSVEIYNEMKTLLDAKNYMSLGLLAHKAKSSVAIMGMNDLAAMLKTFEMDCKVSKNPQNYLTYINRYEMESNEAVTELKHFISNM